MLSFVTARCEKENAGKINAAKNVLLFMILMILLLIPLKFGVYAPSSAFKMDFDSSFGQEKFVGIAHFEVGEFGFEIRAINVFIPAHSDVAHVSFFDLVLFHESNFQSDSN